MDELQWFECRNTEGLLDHLKDKVSDRKLRLFAVACCQHVWHLMPDQRSRKAVSAAERLAEGKCTQDDVWEELDEAESAFQDDEFGEGCADARETAFHVLESPAYEAAFWTASCALNAVYWQEDFDTRTEKGMEAREKAEAEVQVALLRDIFGNPFRPVALDPTWLTSDVLALAGGIYAERAFDRMPILADALQDAGCTNEDVLAHCRDTSLTHVRGCWVVDLVLGKK